MSLAEVEGSEGVGGAFSSLIWLWKLQAWHRVRRDRDDGFAAFRVIDDDFFFLEIARISHSPEIHGDGKPAMVRGESRKVDGLACESIAGALLGTTLKGWISFDYGVRMRGARLGAME